MNFNEAFDTTPTNLNPGDIRITSPTKARRSYIYGDTGSQKGTFRSTAQTRRENLKSADLDNILPAMKDAFDYVVALTSEVSPPIANRLKSQLNTAMRMASQQIESEKKRQS